MLCILNKKLGFRFFILLSSAVNFICPLTFYVFFFVLLFWLLFMNLRLGKDFPIPPEYTEMNDDRCNQN